MIVGCNPKKADQCLMILKVSCHCQKFMKVFCGNVYKENYFSIFNHMYWSLDRHRSSLYKRCKKKLTNNNNSFHLPEKVNEK